MKRIFKVILTVLVLVFIFSTNVSAETLESLTDASGASKLSEHLPEDTYELLEQMGINNNDYYSLQNISFSDVLSTLVSKAGEETVKIMPSVFVILSVLFLYSIFVGVFDSVSNPSLASVLSVLSVLCIACVLLIPVSDLIEKAGNAIKICSDFMLAFIPVMTAVLVSAGQTVTGSGYSAMMVIAAEAVGQFFSKVISPLLSCLLTLGISTSVASEIKLSGLIGFFTKSVKWLMSFVFTLFTSLLTLKSVFSSSVDNVSSRAVRYTMSSFVPVVGGALSEAYRTVHGSVGILKSGVGVFAIIAIVTLFVPIVVRLIIWLFTINMCKTFAEVTSLQSPALILSSVSTVLSLLLSVIFCIIALFVITTALIMIIGGAV